MVAECSANRVLIGMHHSVRSLLHVWTSRVIMAVGDTRNSLALHVPIFDAIKRRDGIAARDAMTTHMQTATRHLLEVLAADGRTLTDAFD